MKPALFTNKMEISDLVHGGTDTVFVQGGTLNPLKNKFTSEEF